MHCAAEAKNTPKGKKKKGRSGDVDVRSVGFQGGCGVGLKCIMLLVTGLYVMCSVCEPQEVRLRHAASHPLYQNSNIPESRDLAEDSLT
eukprot:scaffold98440_cov63-Phaeocystis_antarctica.AAC.2